LRGFLLWLFRLLRREDRSAIEGEIDEEFRFHMDMKAATLMSQGMERAEARDAAVRSFGDRDELRRCGIRDLASIRRRERWARGLGWFGQDLRLGLTHLLRRPTFTLLAGGTLALGLSTSTAVFTYVDAYRRPFPGADAADLRRVFLSTDRTPYGALSWPDYQDLVVATRGVLDVAGIGGSTFGASVRHESLTEVAVGQAVAGDYFSLLGVEMAAGRGLRADDDRPGAEPATVISWGYWVRRYGSDPGAIGRTILLNNRPYTIVGVTGPAFLGSNAESRPQFWLPFEAFMEVYWARSENRTNRVAGAVYPYVRLAGSGPVDRAGAALDALAANLDREAPVAERTRRFTLEPATWISPTAREEEASVNRVMVLAAAFLLLLACANVANVVLAAGARRSGEMAVRAALGASRGRLVRQLVAENVILSAFAGGLALLAAKPIGNRLSAYFARPSVWGWDAPRELAVEPRVILFALGLAIATGVLTGIAPALRASSRDPADALKAGGRWASDARRWPARFPGTRELLVSAQIALCVVLLFLAGLVVRTLGSARDVDAGFDTTTTVATYISTSSMDEVGVEDRHRFFRDIARHFEQMPWVRATAVAEYAPLSPHPGSGLRVEGLDGTVRATVARVFPGYFEALGMEILEGRTLQPNDTSPDRGVVVVNENLARRLAANGRVTGARVWLPGTAGEPDRDFLVVGVVRNARLTSFLDEPEPVAFFSLPQHYSRPGNAFLLSLNGPPASAIDEIERAIHAVDARIAIVNILTYSDVVAGFLYTQRMNAELFTVIAVLGLVLAAAGVFAVVALAVARRQREIGIRIAIGADRVSILGLVVRAIVAPVVLGVAVGLGAALLASRLVDALIWGVAPVDPVSLVAGIAVLIGAVVAAISIPIIRATHIDPINSLRAD
jgi:putative ABC transport system permease protein